MPSPEQPPPEPILKPRLLVVEGDDDSRFLAALLRQLERNAEFEIRKYEGVGNLGGYLRTLAATPGFLRVTSLGIVRDADQNAQSAFQSVCSGLRNRSLSVPQRPIELAGDRPRIGVFIWPDCVQSGTLETLCLLSVADDPAIACVDTFMSCVEDQTGALPKSLPKARLHTFLASRERPGLRLGEAAEKGIWPWDHSVFDPLKGFLRAL
jgi:hypothetical protein